jgi:15-cis-phytoene synthase/lycopene beta-cyclase
MSLRSLLHTYRYPKNHDTMCSKFLLCPITLGCLKLRINQQIAVFWTIPWDSFLIRWRIWSYPTNTIVGPTLFEVPLEEVFFFIIQTYSTTLLYIVLGKGLVLPPFLSGPFGHPEHVRLILWRDIGTFVFSGTAALGIMCIHHGGQYMYMGLIITWACPIMILQW